MHARFQSIAEKLKGAEPLTLIGVGAGIVGAIASLVAAGASVWALHDQWKLAEQEREANKPIANLRVTAGDEKASSVYLTIANPGNTAYIFTEAVVIRPLGWRAVPVRQVNSTFEPQFQSAGIAVLLNLTSYPQRASPSSTEVNQLFTVQAPDVTGDERSNMKTSYPDHVPDHGIEMLLKGHSLSPGAEQIEINVDAVQP